MNKETINKLQGSPVKEVVIELLENLGINEFPLEEGSLQRIKECLKAEFEEGKFDVEKVGQISANVLLLSSNQAHNSSIGADFVGLSEADMSEDTEKEITRYLD